MVHGVLHLLGYDHMSDEEHAEIVRPQKLLFAKTTFACPGATPLTSYAQRRANFTAVSPPSDPPPIRLRYKNSKQPEGSLSVINANQSAKK